MDIQLLSESDRRIVELRERARVQVDTYHIWHMHHSHHLTSFLSVLHAAEELGPGPDLSGPGAGGAQWRGHPLDPRHWVPPPEEQAQAHQRQQERSVLWRVEHKTIYGFLGAYDDAQFIAQRKDESGTRLSRALVLKAQVGYHELLNLLII